MKTFIKITYLVAAGLLLSCGKKTLSPAFPLDLKLRVLDEKGQETTTLQRGQNFILSFILINKTNNLYFLKSMDATNLFAVYKTDNGKVLIGKPWKTMFCSFIIGYPIPANDTTKFEIPWQPDTTKSYGPFCLLNNTDPLTVGNYQTDFSSSFTLINGTQTINSQTLTFNIAFKEQ